MEDTEHYVIGGIKITSKPPRVRSKKGRSSDIATPEEQTSSVIHATDGSFGSEVKALESVRHEFAYLDHPADVIITGSGRSLGEALEAIALGMYNYMTDLSLVVARHCKRVRVEAITLPNILFHFLDECLYLYSSEYFLAKHIRVCDDIDIGACLEAREPVSISFLLYGDIFDPNLHTSGTEVKAITYHEMKIEVAVGDHVAILSHDTQKTQETDALERLLRSADSEALSKCRFKLYTLVDI